MGESGERCEVRCAGWVIAKDPERRYPGLWWLLAVLAATVVFPGLGAVVALGAAWRLPQRRVAFIVLAVLRVVWTTLVTPWGTGGQSGGSVPH